MSGDANEAVVAELYNALCVCLGAMCQYCSKVAPSETRVNGCEIRRIAKAALRKAAGKETTNG